jgi:signal-transduction protein with cAMP-binding, CBS, and nucleotidyltransferase domain
MFINQICSREIDTAHPNESITVVAERMHQRSVGTLVIINDVSQVVGIVTDRDLTTRVLATRRPPDETAVHEVMTVAPRTLQEEASIGSALLTMRAGKFRRIPVVNCRNELVGLITLDDILMSLADDIAEIGRILHRETPRAIAEDQAITEFSLF